MMVMIIIRLWLLFFLILVLIIIIIISIYNVCFYSLCEVTGYSANKDVLIRIYIPRLVQCSFKDNIPKENSRREDHAGKHGVNYFWGVPWSYSSIGY